MTLPDALHKALTILRKETRAAYLESSQARYRLIPSAEQARGYVIRLSVYYNGEWQPWIDVDYFGVDDILCKKWRVV